MNKLEIKIFNKKRTQIRKQIQILKHEKILVPLKS